MQRIVSWWKAVLLLVILTPLCLHAQGHGEVVGDGTITILSPRDGEIVRDRSFSIFVSYEGPADLDHIHYGIDVPDGVAPEGRETFPDLSGEAEVLLEDTDRDGFYEICAYLARVDHAHLSPTACITMELRTSGLNLLSPGASAVVETYDVPVEVFAFGEALDGRIGYVLDDATEPVFVEGPSFVITTTNGLHTATIAAYDEAGEVIGDTVRFAFGVASELTVANAKEVRTLLRKARRKARRRKARAKLLTSAITILDKMLPGGSRHPAVEGLTNDALVVLRNSLRSTLSTRKAGAARRQIRKDMKVLTKILK